MLPFRLVATLIAALVLASPSRADDTPVRPDGYAFGKPRLLTQQLIFGLAHGMDLLATACREAENTGTIAESYGRWRDRYRPRIDEAQRELSRHYFKRDDATADAIAEALHLKAQLTQRPDELAQACQSFAAAIDSNRYDLDLFYTLRQDAARVERADAIRVRVARCLKTLPDEAETRLEERFARWSEANERLDGVSRSRLYMQRGDTPDDLLWRQDAGVGAVPPSVDCDHMAEALDGADHSLATVFDGSSR